MKISTKIKMLASAAVLFASATLAENTFEQNVDVGGKYWLTNTANWSEGVLPTNSGVINAGTDGTLDSATGWNVVQNGSTVGISGAGLVTTLDDCEWTINGGQLGDVNVSLINSTKVTVNSGGTLATGSGRDLSMSGDVILAVNGGTVSVGDQLWSRDQTRITGNGAFTFGKVEVLQNAVMNLTNSTISVSGDFGQRSTKESGGSVTLDGCTLTAGYFKVLKSGFKLNFSGSNEGTAAFDDWVSDGADEGMTIDFGPSTLMSMTLGSDARALVFGGITNADAWAEALWDNNQLLYNGNSSTNLGSLSWADATDSAVGVGTNVYFKFTPDGAYGGTLELAGSALPPPAPKGLMVVTNDGSVGLDWNDSGDDVESYRVFRSTTSGSYSSNALASNLTSSAYLDNTVVNGTTYYYVVTAVKSNGLESAQSTEVSAIPGDYIAPDAPTGLGATAGDGSVSLDWADNSEGDWGSYSVFRSTTSSNYAAALVTGLSSSDYIDSDVTNGVTYYYVVTATDTNSNESVQSAEVSAMPEETSFSEGYIQWLSDNGVSDTPENFYEYAMDSDPTDGLASTNNPAFSKSGNAFIYVHPQRSDDTNLTYTVETTTNLLDSGSWDSVGYTVTGTNVTGETLDFVTNEVDTVQNEKFIRLNIGQ